MNYIFIYYWWLSISTHVSYFLILFINDTFIIGVLQILILCYSNIDAQCMRVHNVETIKIYNYN